MHSNWINRGLPKGWMDPQTAKLVQNPNRLIFKLCFQILLPILMYYICIPMPSRAFEKWSSLWSSWSGELKQFLIKLETKKLSNLQKFLLLWPHGNAHKNRGYRQRYDLEHPHSENHWISVMKVVILGHILRMHSQAHQRNECNYRVDVRSFCSFSLEFRTFRIN